MRDELNELTRTGFIGMASRAWLSEHLEGRQASPLRSDSDTSPTARSGSALSALVARIGPERVVTMLSGRRITWAQVAAAAGALRAVDMARVLLNTGFADRHRLADIANIVNQDTVSEIVIAMRSDPDPDDLANAMVSRCELAALLEVRGMMPGLSQEWIERRLA